MTAKIVIKDLFDNGITEILCLKEDAPRKAEKIRKENKEYGIDAEVSIVTI